MDFKMFFFFLFFLLCECQLWTIARTESLIILKLIIVQLIQLVKCMKCLTLFNGKTNVSDRVYLMNEYTVLI